MGFRIERGRQFAAGDATVTLFDKGGKTGAWLAKATDALSGRRISLTLSDLKTGGTVELKTPQDYQAFLAQNAQDAKATAAFAERFGITFGDFINVLDDAAASDCADLALDLRPQSELAQALSLDGVDQDYATRLAKDAKVNLTGAAGPVEAVAAGTPSIGPEVLAGGVKKDWERDRSEQESWADFKLGNGSSKLFKDNTGPTPYAGLYQPKWSDDAAMAVVNRFALPLHLEVSTPKAGDPPGVKFQDGSELFREVYFDDKAGTLEKSGASVRARMRFDNNPPFTVNRVLVQAKEGRAVDAATGRSAVHKFEKRWEGNSVTEQAAQDMLVSGKDTGGAVLNVSAKLYGLAQEKGTLPADGQLRLEPKYIVLQKRRRTHLQLDSKSEVQARRTAAQAELDAAKAAGTPIDPKLTAFIAKLDTQLAFLDSSSALLSKYGQWMPSGECFIVSADRYSVYDPTARKGNPPNDIDDEVGRIGRGPLHVEAEWDSASSDPFQKALEAVDAKLSATPPPAAADVDALKADRAALEAARETFRADVAATVELLKEGLLKAGLTEEPTKASKDERANTLFKSSERQVFWL